MKFVNETGRYNEVSFFGVAEMSLKKGASEALNILATDTLEHDLPNFCFARGTNDNGVWAWEVLTYMRYVPICKPATIEEAEEVRSLINEAYQDWRTKEEEDKRNKVDEMLDRCWF